MPAIENLLLQGETVREKLSYGEVTVAVTSRGLLVSDSQRVYAVNPRHVSTVGYGFALGELIAGIILVLLSFALSSIADILAFIAFLSGLILAVYGWLYRYRLFITYLGGSIQLRGGSAVPEAARRLRLLIEAELEAQTS